ncbi:hypothetical protein GBAR_LOCUS25542 [Geodia barretti]|uniref:Fibronectin type-III domain-containing protein n=1 Tax=Geodia barretti TaxID=519541 RepID=A0AA35TEQ1_GEOBA|nr:hypothetical protein GBAR_LOCUS25542 [Geodia barretti]
MELVLGVVLLLSGYSACSVVAQEVLHAPGNQTVFPNQSAVFTCETDGGSTGWRVNGTFVDELPPAVEMDLEIFGANTAEGTRLASLTIPAKAEYNGTRVSCFTQRLGGLFMESANVTLRIQGTLSAVAGLSVTSNASSVTISWSAPFSLDVTGVDPDIWYSVLIYNVTDENNPTAILCTDCINITETHYTFTPDYLSPCHVYNFSVIPLNGAGQGERSPNIAITIGKPTFIRSHIKAVCDDVAVTYEHTEMVDEYILHGVSDMDLKNISLSSNQRVSTYTLSANKNFNIFFELITAGGAVNVSHDTFTTYDVQSLSVEEEEGGGVSVRGEFMSGSRAAGCLVVLQGPPSSPDIFRALLRTQSQDTVSTTVPVPPSTYTVYGYDLEENGLPNTMPAVVLESQLTISKGASLVKRSRLLKDATITSQLGSTVVIDCEFSEVYPEASCVLVYREYGSPLLTVVELSQLINFPVSITVDNNPENYTFALFGKDSTTGIEKEPVICMKFDKQAAPIHTPLDMTLDSEKKQETERAVLICVLSCASAVLVFITVRRYRRKKIKDKTAAPSVQTRNAVVYDEVVLPPTSSSVIPTEPNTAYVTTTVSQTTTIPTDQNVAYGVHS